MRVLLVRCAAKVNLCLQIVNRRPDGYHNLRSLMTAVSVWDELQFRPAETFQVTDPFGFLLDENNTVWKAARLLAEAASKPLGFTVTLTKCIPEQAGLGGGSSDGAATLLALRRLWRLRWSWQKLVPLAAKVGADVPFFLCPTGAAVVEGIGERLTPVQLPQLWFVLAKPSEEMPTQKAFALWDAHPVQVLIDPTALAKALWRREAKKIRSLAVNAFEPLIAARIPAVTELKQHLLAAGAVAAVMTGSGTAVVGIFFERIQAMQALEKVRPLAAWSRLARTIRRSIRMG